MRTFTGLKDVDRIILKGLEDKDLLSICLANKYLGNLCDQDFFRNRLMEKYPKSVKHKPDKMTWKNYYLTIISTIEKLNNYGFDYKNVPNGYILDFYDNYPVFMRVGLLMLFDSVKVSSDIRSKLLDLLDLGAANRNIIKLLFKIIEIEDPDTPYNDFLKGATSNIDQYVKKWTQLTSNQRKSVMDPQLIDRLREDESFLLNKLILLNKY